jgi:hypothetical protein
MGHLEHVRLETPAAPDRRPLGPLFHVARKQNGSPAQHEPERERAVVVASRPVRLGPDGLDPRAPEFECVPGAQFDDGHARRLQPPNDSRSVAAEARRDERSPDGKVVDDRVEASRVVRVTVADRDEVEPRDA